MISEHEEVIDLQNLDTLLKQQHYMPLIMLDGFFAGLACLDEDVPPSQWSEYIALEESKTDPQTPNPELLPLLESYYESIIHDLAHRRFKPLLDEEESLPATKSWANGFLAALSIEDMAWLNEAPEDIYAMINMLFCYRLPDDEAGEQLKLLFDKPPPEEKITQILNKFPEAFELIAIELFKYKVEGVSVHQHHQDCGCPSHAPPSAQRNDPCPCGSGKKFKKCCLH